MPYSTELVSALQTVQSGCPDFHPTRKVVEEIVKLDGTQHLQDLVCLILIIQQGQVDFWDRAEEYQHFIDGLGWTLLDEIRLLYTGERCAALDFFTDLRIITAWPFTTLTPERVFEHFNEQTPIVFGDLRGFTHLGRYLGAFCVLGIPSEELITIMRNSLRLYLGILEETRETSASPESVFRYLHICLVRQKAPTAFITSVLAHVEIELNISSLPYVSKAMLALQTQPV